MRCRSCRRDSPANSRFCAECGAALPAACGRCHAELAPSAKFCGACGERVATRTIESTAGAAPTIHTPKRLTDRILTSKTLLEGERKQVTVLFADMRASMELMSDRDPEETRA